MLTIYSDGECIVVEGLHRTFDGEVCSRCRSVLDDDSLGVVMLRGYGETVTVALGEPVDGVSPAVVGVVDRGQIPWPTKVRSAYEYEYEGTVYVEVDCGPDVTVEPV